MYLRGRADLHRRRHGLEEVATKLLEDVESAANRAAEFSRNILSFSRQHVIERTRFDLSDAIIELPPILRPLLGGKSDLVVLPSLQPAFVDADRSQIEQVFVNLAVNARDAMSAGGTLTIETTVERSSGSSQTGTILVTVSDTGDGMPSEVQQRIFDPFFTTKPMGEGTGLGLSTSLGVVERHGGRLLLQTSGPDGTVFRIVLPRCEKAESPDVESIASGQAVGGSETVLLVDDETRVRRFADRVPEDRGYHVLQASNGQEAIQAAASLDSERAIDLLISDVVMPLMGGFDLARELQQSNPDLAVIFVSGFLGRTAKDEAHDIVDAVFLQKPFSVDGMAACVRDRLEARAEPR